MTTFTLTDEHAQMGKISNNLEKHGGGDEPDLITGFSLPLKLRVPREQTVALMGQEFERSCWAALGTGVVAQAWARRITPIALHGEVYVGAAAELHLGGEELTFKDCRVSDIEIVGFEDGGYTLIECQLYVKPGIGNENLLLQEYQKQEIAVQLSSGKLRVKADKAQQQLPLEAPQAAPAPETLEEALATDEEEQLQAESEHGVGTPEEEREKARLREVSIAQQLEDAHVNGDGPGDERKPPKRAPRRSVSGDAVN